MQKSILCIVLVAMFLFSSCSLAAGRGAENNELLGGERAQMLNEKDDGNLASIRLEQILEAIKNQDKVAIKDMFSEQAQTEVPNMDEGVDYLFSLMKENIKSWEKIGGSVDMCKQNPDIDLTCILRMNNIYFPF